MGALRFEQKKGGPGKFEGESAATRVVWQLSLDGADESAGGSGGGASYGKMEGPFLLDALQDEECVNILEEYGTAEDLALLATAVGCIISEDSQGFVHGEFFDETPQSVAERMFEGSWDEVLEAEGESDEGDEDAEEEP